MIKHLRFFSAFCLIAAAFGLVGCGKNVSPAERLAVQKAVENRAATQTASLATPLEQMLPLRLNETVRGQQYQTVSSGGSITARQIWIYKPDAAKNGPVRCVVMAPAGSHLFDGMNLSSGDSDEHTLYLFSGIAVIACEVDGALPDNDQSDKAITSAAQKFIAARAGIRNMQSALDIAQSLPWIDKNHIYAAGHSSAATLALQTAAYDKRVAGCIALAPEVNVPRFVQGAGQIEAAGATGLVQTLDALSPHNNLTRLTKPVFLFCAEDDSVIRPADVKAFAADLKKTNKSVTLQTVSDGGHYEAMIKHGIPSASQWLLKQP